ncbi:MAG: VCBS repeat-containing protein, partial [Anaerolineae bacterium]|nr:VCBS repeat-containing protein [Anaerolineae bacterium]
DGDGDLDAFVANRAGVNKVWLNNGTGIFTETQSLGSADSLGVALGDVDSDGDLDAFVANFGYADGEANRVWLNLNRVFLPVVLRAYP